MTLKRLTGVIATYLLISGSTYATAVQEKDLKFMPSTESLMKSEVHVTLKVVSPQTFIKKYSDLFYLDSLGFTNNQDISIVLSKTAFVVSKPAGFFDHLNSGDERYLAHILGDQKVEKISENNFKVTVPGADGNAYTLRTYFDSDDISTLPNSKVIRAVTQSRKMDVISGSASSTTFRELTKFTRCSLGSVQVSNFIPLKENKTLILSYTVSGVKKNYSDRRILSENLRREAESQQKLINSYNP